MKKLKMITIIMLSVCLSSCLCGLISGNNGYRIIADKLYGSITANGIDITEEVHSGKYSYFEEDDIIFEFIPNTDLDVEFSGWCYRTGFFSDNETLITNSNTISTQDGIYWQMYPGITTPDVFTFREDPGCSDVIIDIFNRDETIYRYIKFENGMIQSITPVPLESSIYLYGLKAGTVYYSQDYILYSYSIENDTHEQILEYSDDNVRLRNYNDTGFILYTHSVENKVISFHVMNLETGQINTYTPPSGITAWETILSGDGNVILIEAEENDDTIIAKIDISAGSMTTIMPQPERNLQVSYQFLDIDTTGETFCYYASYSEQTIQGLVYDSSGTFMYSDESYEISDKAVYSNDGWTIALEDDGETAFYSLTPNTFDLNILFTLPLYRSNINYKNILKTGIVNFTLTTPDIESFYLNRFTQYAFYSYDSDSIYIIPAKYLIDCKVEYISDYITK